MSLSAGAPPGAPKAVQRYERAIMLDFLERLWAIPAFHAMARDARDGLAMAVRNDRVWRLGIWVPAEPFWLNTHQAISLALRIAAPDGRVTLMAQLRESGDDVVFAPTLVPRSIAAALHQNATILAQAAGYQPPQFQHYFWVGLALFWAATSPADLVTTFGALLTVVEYRWRDGGITIKPQADCSGSTEAAEVKHFRTVAALLARPQASRPLIPLRHGGRHRKMNPKQFRRELRHLITEYLSPPFRRRPSDIIATKLAELMGLDRKTFNTYIGEGPSLEREVQRIAKSLKK